MAVCCIALLVAGQLVSIIRLVGDLAWQNGFGLWWPARNSETQSLFLTKESVVLIFALPCLVSPALLLMDYTPDALMLLQARLVGISHLVITLARCSALVI